MSVDLSALVVGPCSFCGCAVTEADSWGPSVHTLDSYPPKKTPVYHTSCRTEFYEREFDRKYGLGIYSDPE